jgi:hypothetical protein
MLGMVRFHSSVLLFAASSYRDRAANFSHSSFGFAERRFNIADAVSEVPRVNFPEGHASLRAISG